MNGIEEIVRHLKMQIGIIRTVGSDDRFIRTELSWIETLLFSLEEANKEIERLEKRMRSEVKL